MARAWSRIDWQEAYGTRWRSTQASVPAALYYAGEHWSRENGLEEWPLPTYRHNWYGLAAGRCAGAATCTSRRWASGSGWAARTGRS